MAIDGPSLRSPLIPDVPTSGGTAIDRRERRSAEGDRDDSARIVLGFMLAFAIAIAVGLASARNRLARFFFEPALLLGLTVPGLVWALLCVIWFGLGIKTSVVAIALGIAPALAVSSPMVSVPSTRN